MVPYNWQEIPSSQLFPGEGRKGLNHVLNTLNFLGTTQRVGYCLACSRVLLGPDIPRWVQRTKIAVCSNVQVFTGSSFSLGKERVGGLPKEMASVSPV